MSFGNICDQCLTSPMWRFLISSLHIKENIIDIIFNFQLSRSAFPLCMRQLHTALKENHHLKHGGRLQYGLFLKVSILCSLDEIQRILS